MITEAARVKILMTFLLINYLNNLHNDYAIHLHIYYMYQVI